MSHLPSKIARSKFDIADLLKDVINLRHPWFTAGEASKVLVSLGAVQTLVSCQEISATQASCHVHFRHTAPLTYCMLPWKMMTENKTSSASLPST